jgi:hypothetical protein
MVSVLFGAQAWGFWDNFFAVPVFGVWCSACWAQEKQFSHVTCTVLGVLYRTVHTIFPFPVIRLARWSKPVCEVSFNPKVMSGYSLYVYITRLRPVPNKATVVPSSLPIVVVRDTPRGPISAVCYTHTHVLDSHNSGARYGSGRNLHLAYTVTSPKRQLSS